MARADLSVYNIENFCVKLHPFFTYKGGGDKKKFFWAYLITNVRHWVKEVEAGDIGIEDLSFERGVRCTTNNEEVKTLCRVLGLAQQ